MDYRDNLTGKKVEILRRLDQWESRLPLVLDNTDTLELMEEYADTDDHLSDLVNRYSGSRSLHFVNRLTLCLRRRAFSIKPARGTSLALRVMHLHRCELNAETLEMLSALLDLATLEDDAVPDLRKLALLCLEQCTKANANPPVSLWPTIDLLDRIREEGLLEKTFSIEDKLYAADHLTVAVERYGSSLDEDDRAKYLKLLTAIGDPECEHPWDG